jgi:NAD(P)-dependent dehydrogenase (short-subunit alcohol dehydrogenase family)
VNQTPLSDRVAWVTGASSGIGRALARRLAENGCRVAASARSAGELDALADEVPGRITAFELDVTDPKACLEVHTQIATTLGPVDLAVLNAGSYFPTTTAEFSVENFRRTVDVNLMGAVNCMGAVAPSMVARRAGHIAIMASLTGYLGLPIAASYGATKAALISMAHSFRPDFERYGVTITVINPGFVKTPLTDKNKFPMPFLMPLDKAIDHIMRGLETKRFEIAFPWQIALGMKLLRAMPEPLRFAAMRRMLRDEDSGG